MTRRAALALLLCAAAGASAQPYDASPYLSAMEIDWSTAAIQDCNADNWPATWHDDGHQYLSWGDGSGFEASCPTASTIGFGRIEGTWASHTFHNVFGFSAECTYDASMSGKTYAMASVNGNLYIWWSTGSNVNIYSDDYLAWSDDEACTWTKHGTDLDDSDASDVHAAHIVNCEQGGDQSCDGSGYLYEVWVGTYDEGSLTIQSGGAPDGGRLFLSRVTPANIQTYSSRDWFSGTASSPAWSSSAASKAEIFYDANGTGWVASMEYIAALDRYILMTEHTTSGVAGTGAGCLGVYESRNPYGPWLTVSYYTCTGDDHFGFGEVDESTFFWNIPLKWVEADVATTGDFILFFTGVGNNDAWQAVEASFTVNPAYRGDTTYSLTGGGLSGARVGQ